MGQLNFSKFFCPFCVVKIMKKKIRFRMLQRILILLLCTALVSGTCFNKCKISARATTVTVGVGACTLYEICLYIGTLLVSGIGIGFAVENRDQIAKMGKDFIDACDLSTLSGWVLSKADTTGQSYVYGTEALQEVKDTTFEVIQGGGNAPKNDDDNDNDGDIDAADRTVELQNVGMWATTGFTAWICDKLQPFLEEAHAGGSNFITENIGYNTRYPSFATMNANGEYEYYYDWEELAFSYGNRKHCFFDLTMTNPCVGYVSSSGEYVYVTYYDEHNDSLYYIGSDTAYQTFVYYENGTMTETSGQSNGSGKLTFSSAHRINANFPIFSNSAAAWNYIRTGSISDCLNSQIFRIADWLQEDWQGNIDALNAGIRSLYDNMLIVGEAANQAMLNQLNGLGYIEDLLARLAAALALPLPDTVSDPVYYPDTSEDPGLEELPWEDVVPIPDPDPAPVPDPTPEPEPEPDEDLDIQNYVVDLRQVFPFCIPFDLMALFGALAADPVAPRFEIPFVVPSLGIEETYVIDLSFFDEQMVLLRKLELVGFIIGLMLLTGKVIKW